MGMQIGVYGPKIIFLLRHPAGVAASLHRLQWFASLNQFSSPDDDLWFRLGDFQGRVLTAAQEQIRTYPAVEFVHYEEVCREPLRAFRRLFAFAGLAWRDHTERQIRRQSMLGEARGPSDNVTRNSRAQSDRWKRTLSDDQVQAVMAGFERHRERLLVAPAA